MDKRRCLVAAAILGSRVEFSRQLGPGQIVDLDEPMGELTLKDFVKEQWFEPLEGADQAATVTRRRARGTDSDRALGATESTHHGD